MKKLTQAVKTLSAKVSRKKNKSTKKPRVDRSVIDGPRLFIEGNHLDDIDRAFYDPEEKSKSKK